MLMAVQKKQLQNTSSGVPKMLDCAIFVYRFVELFLHNIFLERMQ